MSYIQNHFLESSSYGGEIFRPSPEIWTDEKSSLISIMTPWGKSTKAKDSLDFLRESLGSSHEDLDEDITSAFEFSDQFSVLGNQLRRAVLMLNQRLLENENKYEYKFGIEMILGGFFEYEFTWVQIGQPYVYLMRKNKPLISLSMVSDFSLEHSTEPVSLPPLPKDILGILPLNNVTVNSLRVNPGDRLLFLSRSLVPSHLGVLKENDRNMKSLRKILSSDDEKMPFWLGILEVGKWLD